MFNNSVRERYNSDPTFHTLVDMMVAFIFDAKFTPSEMREAAILASIIYEQESMHRFTLPSIPQHVEKGLEDLHEWVDKNSRISKKLQG